ncbi:MAG: SAM-dependent methyltransferase, partial [Cyanobacteria bacterium PR.3.49]|nr:SAM-dependent methyltransferase [Cyanobacteria bacterium PR.3.49]
MNIAQIEENVQKMMQEFSPQTFIYDLLTAYGKPKSNINRLQKGNLNQGKLPDEVIWKKTVWFRGIDSTQRQAVTGIVSEVTANYDLLHSLADQLRKSTEAVKHNVRFVLVTDYKRLLGVDMKTGETLDIPILDLPKHVPFLLPLIGKEKHKAHTESHADIKAAERMGKLYDEISKDNPEMDSHSLNVFLSRLLFCFFAEDTDIFPKKGMFTASINSHTQDDGSDLNSYLDRLFEVMNKLERSDYPVYLQEFPFVNGGLFADSLKAPQFSRQARSTVVACGGLDWSEINPDIFGSMMQAVVHKEERGKIGMHYTSVSNIMKVIEPLFLSQLRDAFEENFDNAKGLEKLRARLSTIKVFDPACGSGNFLIIAYKELRRLEMEIFVRLRELNINYQTMFTMPQIQLTQFFGIELDDFAHEIAILSMWLAEHQMNVKYKESLGISVPSLPLKESGKIVCGNATRLDWNVVCPKDDKSEFFILGNPPYLGVRYQDQTQKADMAVALKPVKSYKKLDYIACWFVKGGEYIKNANAQLGFVSTNSICQGELVGILFPHLLTKENLEIGFAHRSFKWTNNAKRNAGVTVVIIGLRNKSKQPRYLFSGGEFEQVDNISAYLSKGNNTIVLKRSKPLSDLPEMGSGNKATDGGHLMLSPTDKKRLIETNPNTRKFIKRVYGSNEFIKGVERWCLWIPDDLLEEAIAVPVIARRIESVRQSRLESTDSGANDLAKRPHQFREFVTCKKNSI